MFGGIYKTFSDAPERITRASMTRNMDRLRVRVSILLVAVGCLGALSSALLGKDVQGQIEEAKEYYLQEEREKSCKK